MVRELILAWHPGYEPGLGNAFHSMGNDLQDAMAGGFFGFLAGLTIFVLPVVAGWWAVTRRSIPAALSFVAWVAMIGGWFAYRMGLDHRWAPKEPGQALTLLFAAGAVFAWCLLALAYGDRRNSDRTTTDQD